MWAFLESIRATNRLALLIAVEAFAAVVLWWNRFPMDAVGRAINELGGATNGWISAPLVFPLVALGLLSFAFFHIGHLRCADVGWRAPELVLALVVTLLFWLCSQGALWLATMLEGHEPTWGWTWRDQEGSLLAGLVGQLIGTVLVEETFFRGFLLPQVFLRMSRVAHKKSALVVALLVSLALFVLSHVPRLINEAAVAGGELPEPLLWTTGFGLIMTVCFLVTRNLLVCVGLHALFNTRAALIEAPWQRHEWVWWVLTFVLVCGWWLGERVRRLHAATAGSRASESAM